MKTREDVRIYKRLNAYDLEDGIGDLIMAIDEEFTLRKNALEQTTGYKIDGIKDHKPLYISFDDVICVYRDMEAEEDNE